MNTKKDEETVLNRNNLQKMKIQESFNNTNESDGSISYIGFLLIIFGLLGGFIGFIVLLLYGYEYYQKNYKKE